MKFRNGQDKGFRQAVRTKSAAHVRISGSHPLRGLRVAAKGCTLLAATSALYAAILGNRSDGWPPLLTAALFLIHWILVSFNLARDALTPSRPLNRAVYVATFLLDGTSACLWKRHVGSHHTLPDIKGGDADVDDNPFLRVTATAPHRWYFRHQHLYAPSSPC